MALRGSLMYSDDTFSVDWFVFGVRHVQQTVDSGGPKQILIEVSIQLFVSLHLFMPLLCQPPLGIYGPSTTYLLILLNSALLELLDALFQLLANLRILSRNIDDPLELQLCLDSQLGYVDIQVMQFWIVRYVHVR